MAARITEVEVGFDQERIARDLGMSLAGALSDIAGRLIAQAYPDTEDRPTEPQIMDWPIKSHPPLVIARCPHCDDSIEANPVTWEIVIDPTVTTTSTTVRGQMQHEHDEGVLVRWPFVATYTPPPVDDEWEPIDVPVIWDDPDIDVDEGQQKDDSEPWAFTPDGEGDVSLSAAVFQALGGASTAWRGGTGDLVFDGTRAREIGDALLKFIEQRIEQDERVQAWETVAKHPYLRPAYETERTLLAAVLERLDESARIDAERVRLDRIIYRARTALSNVRYMTRDSDVMLVQGVQEARDHLAAVDGPDSPAAKRLRGEA